jgi:hypothetical protein
MPQTLYPSLSAPAPPAPWFEKCWTVRQPGRGARRSRRPLGSARLSIDERRLTILLPKPSASAIRLSHKPTITGQAETRRLTTYDYRPAGERSLFGRSLSELAGGSDEL